MAGVKLSCIWILAVLTAESWGQQVYLTLGSTNITTNNTDVFITDIEEAYNSLLTLTCYTDLTTCCRNSDTGGQGGRGEWLFPNGRNVQNNANSGDDTFYFIRNGPQLIRLARKTYSSNPLSPTGTFCCVIPTTGGEMTFCANIVLPVPCSDLPVPTNGQPIAYTAGANGNRSVNTVATYSCDSGYILIGNSNRDCQSDGTWSGRAPTCEVSCPVLSTITNGMFTYISGSRDLRLTGSVARYSCDSDYTLVGNSTRNCQSDGTWSDRAPTCEFYCPVLSMVANGMITYISGSPTVRPVGTTATYSCNSGYFFALNSGNILRTCQQSGHWTGSAPSCGVPCPVLTITNGQVSYVDMIEIDPPGFPMRRPSNTRATITCNSGLVLVGDSYTVCQSDGTWSGSVATCQRDCGSLTDPTNGVVDTSAGTLEGMTATYTCDPGYTLNGIRTRTCEADGVWSSAEPTCQIYCPILSTITNGTVSYNSGSSDVRPVGTVATYSCNSGYFFVLDSGTVQRTCQSSGQWDGSAPSCGMPCPVLTISINGFLLYSISDAPPGVPGTRATGVQATITCNSGHTLIGDNTRACQSDGTWSGSETTCQRDCGPLTDPPNGTVDTSAGTTEGMTATYTCDTGYTFTGMGTRTCGIDGMWRPPEPTCQAICPPLPKPKNGLVVTYKSFHDSAYIEGTVATYTCDNNSLLIGEETRVCLSDHTWSHDPYCSDQVVVQLQFGPTSSCLQWSQQKAFTVSKYLHEAIHQTILDGSEAVPWANIDDGVFTCRSSSTHTTYRTTINGTRDASAVQAAADLQKWVESGPVVRVEWYLVDISRSCPVSIGSLTVDECIEDKCVEGCVAVCRARNG